MALELNSFEGKEPIQEHVLSSLRLQTITRKVPYVSANLYVRQIMVLCEGFYPGVQDQGTSCRRLYASTFVPSKVAKSGALMSPLFLAASNFFEHVHRHGMARSPGCRLHEGDDHVLLTSTRWLLLVPYW